MTSWVIYGLISAFFLGFYDVAKKQSVHGNAALKTLWVCTSFGSLICVVLLLVRSWFPSHSVIFKGNDVVTIQHHVAIFGKAIIVSCSWTFAYLSLKHLPISIVAPIRASGPIWTLMGAMVIFGELPNVVQGVGFCITIISYLFVSLVGRKEGIVFLRNPWVGCIVAGTFIGAGSGLYDKYLIQSKGLHPMDVQLWFSVDMLFVQGIILALARKWFPERTPFQWRWSMPLVAILLLLADAAYFHGIQDPTVQIGLLSATRRGSLLVAFGLGAFVFKDQNVRGKILPVLGVLVGIIMIAWGSH